MGFSQKEKKQELEEVAISEEKAPKLSSIASFSQEEIQQIAPQDLGHLLQFTSGIALRSYGGLGGMKTISMRGLGGEHTGLVVNGLPQRNAQNAQTDFGTIQVDNVEEIQVSNGVGSDGLLPVSAQLLGSLVEISTFENSYSNQKLAGRASTLLGSYGQQEVFLGLKSGWGNGFISASGKFRKADGNYFYRIPMGAGFYEGTRRNNALQEYFYALGGGWKFPKKHNGKPSHVLKWNAQRDVANKELPGAVIFYNDLADQSLETENTRIGVQLKSFYKDLKLVHFANVQHFMLDYFDPSFLNSTGFLHNNYRTNSLTFGSNVLYRRNALSFYSGIELASDNLTANRPDLGTPNRKQSNANFGINYETKNVVYKAAVFHQHLEDRNRMINHIMHYHRFNPMLAIQTSEQFSKRFQINAWFKKSMRPPSFNELYYSQIGNNALEPEDAIQVNIGVNYNKSLKNSRLNLSLNGYHNQVSNKILALPTKNLFVWSVQNIGAVNVLGTDLNASFLVNKDNWKSNSSGSISFQNVVDVTDESSPTYRHQLAYVPKLSGNLVQSLFYKNTGLHATLFLMGQRYSLNQNIPANEVASFYVLDFSASHEWKWKNKKLRAQLGVRNVTDNHYVFIRSFVMPGRNYFIQLNYGF